LLKQKGQVVTYNANVYNIKSRLYDARKIKPKYTNIHFKINLATVFDSVLKTRSSPCWVCAWKDTKTWQK